MTHLHNDGYGGARVERALHGGLNRALQHRLILGPVFHFCASAEDEERERLYKLSAAMLDCKQHSEGGLWRRCDILKAAYTRFACAQP